MLIIDNFLFNCNSKSCITSNEIDNILKDWYVLSLESTDDYYLN